MTTLKYDSEVTGDVNDAPEIGARFSGTVSLWI